MLSTPYTQWDGDQLHGRYPKLRAVWVRLDAVYPRPDDAPVHIVAEGLDLSGAVPGLLSGWFRSVQGDWFGIVNFAVPYADGRREHVHLVDQLIPSRALRRREEPPGA